jgi:hypothetical protein
VSFATIGQLGGFGCREGNAQHHGGDWNEVFRHLFSPSKLPRLSVTAARETITGLRVLRSCPGGGSQLRKAPKWTTSKPTRATAQALIQGYIGPDHKVMNMQNFYAALVSALMEAHRSNGSAKSASDV